MRLVRMRMVRVLMAPVAMSVAVMSVAVMSVPVNVEMGTRTVSIKRRASVPMMSVGKTQALVGRHQDGEQQYEEPANHGELT